MEIENRLLLYSVALGALVMLASLLRRRAFTFWVHLTIQTVLLVVSVGTLVLRERGDIDAATLGRSATISMTAFTVLSLMPVVALTVARRCASARRYGAATLFTGTASALLGFPVPIRREAQFYGALGAAERGDEEDCAERFEELVELGAIPPSSGGALLARVMPLAAGRRWSAALGVLDATAARGSVPLVIESRAAAETGDLPRALRACHMLELSVGSGSALLSQARRSILACAGRAEFLDEAAARGLPVMDGPRGARDLHRGRALEAAGDREAALASYRSGLPALRGQFRRDAEDGIRRCEEGRPRLALTVGEDLDAVLDLEDECRRQGRSNRAPRLAWRRSVIVWTSVLTTLVSIAAWIVWGDSWTGLLASGALSAPLILDDGQWWRLFTTMLLHGGTVHLANNVGSILLVGILLERRVGGARTLVAYLASGALASFASAWLNGTPLGVGASGGAMGLFGAFGVLLHFRRDDFDPAERRRWLRVLWITVAAVALLGALERQALDNVAHGVGLLTGAAIGVLFLRHSLEIERAFRVAAVALGGLLLASVGFALADSGEWTGTRAVEGAGASVVLPTWMHVRATPDGLVAARPPADIRLQIGALATVRPDPLTLTGEHPDPGVLAALERGPDLVGNEDLLIAGAPVRVRYERYIVPVDQRVAVARFEVRRVERRGAFVLTYLPIPVDAPAEGPPPDGIDAAQTEQGQDDDYADLGRDIGRTLHAIGR